MNIIESLNTFITIAEKNRKYPPATAGGRKAALKMFSAELTEDEKGSFETFKNNLNKIYAEIARKNSTNMSAATLEEYKRRVKATLSDYEQYGIDPTKMNTWNPPTRVVSKTRAKPSEAAARAETAKSPQAGNVSSQMDIGPSAADNTKIEISLRPGVKAFIIVPIDITKAEAMKVAAYIKVVEALATDSSSSMGSESKPNGEEEHTHEPSQI